jgi:uncharacterized protein (TIGR02145 family)
MADSEAMKHPIACSSPEEDCLENLWWGNGGVGYCAAIFEESDDWSSWTWNYTELMPNFNSSSYQGICPEGWRIPNKSDWEILQHYIMKLYGVDSARVGTVLADEIGFGFRMKNDLLPYHENGDWMFASPIRSYIAVPDFQDGAHVGASGVLVDDRMTYAYWMVKTYNYHYVYDTYLIRCIKN